MKYTRVQTSGMNGTKRILVSSTCVKYGSSRKDKFENILLNGENIALSSNGNRTVLTLGLESQMQICCLAHYSHVVLDVKF